MKLTRPDTVIVTCLCLELFSPPPLFLFQPRRVRLLSLRASESSGWVCRPWYMLSACVDPHCHSRDLRLIWDSKKERTAFEHGTQGLVWMLQTWTYTEISLCWFHIVGSLLNINMRVYGRKPASHLSLLNLTVTGETRKTLTEAYRCHAYKSTHSTYCV